MWCDVVWCGVVGVAREQLRGQIERLHDHIARRELDFNNERKGFFRDVMMVKELARRAGVDIDNAASLQKVATSIGDALEQRMRDNSGAQAAQTAYFQAESRRNEELVASNKVLEAEKTKLEECVRRNAHGVCCAVHQLLRCSVCDGLRGGIR